MSKLLKGLLILAGALVLVVVAAGVLLPMLVDNDEIKRNIAEEVTRQTGRELRIDGPLELSVFPVLAVEVNALSLGNAEGFGDQPLARIGQARIGVGLLPLLRRQLRAETVVLSGLQVNLAVNERGAVNWGGLSREDPPQPVAESDGALAMHYIAGLDISDANIDYRDARAGSHYRLSGFSLQTGTLGAGGPVPAELSMRLEDIAAGTALELQLSAEADIDATARRHTLANLELRLATGGAPLVLTAPAVLLDLAEDTLNLERVEATLGGLAARGSLQAKRVSASPSVTGMLEVAEFSPFEVMEALGLQPPPTADGQVLRSLSFRGSFAGDHTRMTLPDLDMRLDDSRIEGKLALASLDSAPALRFSFDIDQLDLDRYLAPASEDPADATEDVALPGEELAGLDVEGALRVERLKFMGVDFTAAELGLRVQDEVLRIDPLRAGFYGGQYVGNIMLDASGPAPTVSLDERIESVIFAQLASDLLGYEQVSGTAHGSLRARGSGRTTSELLDNLEGSLELRLDEGALEGVDVWYQIRSALARVKGQPAPEGDTGRTVFSRLVLEADIGGGMVEFDQLLGELPFLRLTGNGSVGLNTMQVDMGLLAGVRSSPELSADPLAADLEGREIPFRIHGSASQPEVSVDVEALLKGEATRALMDRLGLPGKEDTTDGDADEGATRRSAKDLLGGLLGRKKDREDEDKDKDGG